MANEDHLRPPEEHIARALRVEECVPEKEWDDYLDCMNGKPMSQRVTARELYDGCILTGVYEWCRRGQEE